MATFEAALRKVIRPGDVVLDLGAGTGVLSFIALAAGAARVYALERSPVIEVARAIAAANGFEDRMKFIQGDARAVAAVEPVDCLVGDVRGTLPLLGDNIELLAAVRERWLRSGGATVPLFDEILFAPVAARADHDRVTGWSLTRAEARYDAARRFAANAFIRTNLAPDDVLAQAHPLGVVSYVGSTAGRLHARCDFVIERDATLTGVGAWFRGVLADGVVIDTSPFAPATIYAQAFFPLAEPRAVRAGEPIAVELSVHRVAPEPIWSWKLSSAGDSAGAGWRESHSTFEGALLGLDTLALLDGTRCASRSPDGAIAHLVLQSLDGRTPVRAIAARLAEALPGRFASAEDAVPEVMKVLGQYAVP